MEVGDVPAFASGEDHDDDHEESHDSEHDDSENGSDDEQDDSEDSSNEESEDEGEEGSGDEEQQEESGGGSNSTDAESPEESEDSSDDSNEGDVETFSHSHDEDDDTDYSITAELSGTFEPGDEIEFEGEVENSVESIEEIEMIVQDPDGDEIDSDDTDVDEDGEFDFEFDLDDDAEEGTYTITLTYGEATLELTFDVVGEGNGVTAELSKEVYEPGDTVELSGEVEGDVDEIEISVRDPDDEEIVDEEEVDVDDDEFEFEFDLDDDAEEGEYTVILSFDHDELEITFEVQDDEEDDEDDESDQDYFGYSYIDTDDDPSIFSWIEISSDGTEALTSDGWTEIPIGFDFDFYGSTYNNIIISTDGVLVFDEDDVPEGPNKPIHANRAGKIGNIIAPFWDDLTVDGESPGTVYYKIIGEEPERILVIEWESMAHAVKGGGHHDDDEDDEHDNEDEDNEHSNGQIEAELSEDEYQPGDRVELTGEIDDADDDIELEIVVRDPDGNEIQSDDDVNVKNNGKFDFEFDLDDDAEEDTYTVILTYGEDELVITFEVDDGSNTTELTITFQVLLYEGSNDIKFQYDATSFDDHRYDDGRSATVGIAGPENKGLQYSHNKKNSIQSGLAILFGYPHAGPIVKQTSENLGVTDLIQVDYTPGSQSISIELEESIQMADGIDATLSRFVSVSTSDTIAVTEGILVVHTAAPLDHFVSIEETLSFNDDVDGSARYYLSIADSLELSSAVSRSAELSRAVSEEMTVQVSFDSSYSGTRALADNASLGEVLASQKELAPENRFSFVVLTSITPPIKVPSLESETLTTSAAPIPLFITADTDSTGQPVELSLTVFGLPRGVSILFDEQSPATSSGLPTLGPVTIPQATDKTIDMDVQVSSSAQPGSYVVTIRAQDDSDSDVIIERQVTVIIEANTEQSDTAIGKLGVTPKASIVGGTVTLQAYGFTPDNPVSVSFGSTAISIPPGTKFDSTGSISLDITVPVLPPGTYPVAISDSVSSASASLSLLSSTDKFSFTVSPTILPAVTQGETSSMITVSVTSETASPAPDTEILIRGLGPGMTAFWKKGAIGDFNSFQTSSLQLKPGAGQTQTANIIIQTSDATPPTKYSLQLIARGLDSTGQTETVVAELVVKPIPEVAQSVPAIVVNPSSAKPTSGVSLSGTGFAPQSTFNSVALAVSGQNTPTIIQLGSTVVVDSNGEWTTGFSVPSNAVPGTYIVTVTTANPAITASTKLEIIQQAIATFGVVLSTDAVPLTKDDPDGAIIAMGLQSVNQFSSPVTLTVSSLPVGMTISFTEVDGTALVTYSGRPEGTTRIGTGIITPPLGGTKTILIKITADSQTPDGTYSVFLGASEPGSQNTKAKLVGITVTSPSMPSLTLSPLQGGPESTVNIMGSGFGEEELVTLRFGSASIGTNGFASLPSTIVTTDGGTFSAEITVPILDGGVYQLKATGESSGTVAFTSFKVLPMVDEGTVQLQIAPKGLVVPAFSEGNQTITIMPVGMFSSSVEIVATQLVDSSGQPPITISFGSDGETAQITPGNPSTLTMFVQPTALPSSQEASMVRVQVQAIDVDTGDVLTTERVLVRVTDPAGDFFISASPADLVVQRGTEVSSTLRVITSGLLGLGSPAPAFDPVANLPAGVTAEIQDVSAIDSSGIATATLVVSVAEDAGLGTSSFSIGGNISGLATKNLNMSLVVVASAPVSFAAPNFDPTTLTENSPLHLSFPFQENESGLTLSIRSLITNVYGASTIDYFMIPDSTDEMGDEPEGFTLLMTGTGQDIINMEPSSPASVIEYDVCIDLPEDFEGDPSDVKIAFLDTTQSPPVWTTVDSTVSDDMVCAIGITHFSSWALLAASAIVPTPTPTPAVTQAPSGGRETVHIVTTPLEEEHVPETGSMQGFAPFSPPEKVGVGEHGYSDGRVLVTPYGGAFESEVPESQQDADSFYISNFKITPHVVSIHPLARFFEPAARLGIVFDVEPITQDRLHSSSAPDGSLIQTIEPELTIAGPTATSGSHHNVATGHEGGLEITYYMIDSQQRVVSSGKFYVDEFGTETVHTKAYAPVYSDGIHTIKLAVKIQPGGHDGGRIIATATTGSEIVIAKAISGEVDVPWIIAYLSVILEISLVITGAVIAIGTISKHKRRLAELRQLSRSEPEKRYRGFPIVTASRIIVEKVGQKIGFTFHTVILGVAALMLISSYFVVFAGDLVDQEAVGMWVINIAASVSVLLALALFIRGRKGAAAKTRLALAIGLVLWLGSRAVETWFNTVIPTLLTKDVLHQIYPGDFLLTFITSYDLPIFSDAFGGGYTFAIIYGLFTALKMGGFVLFCYHLFSAASQLSERHGKKLTVASMIAPTVFLGMITVSYINVLMPHVLLLDFLVHYGYLILLALMMVPSMILLVVLRKDTHSELFWVLSTLSLLAFVAAYSWQAFVPTGTDPEAYLHWIETNIWLSPVLFGGDYLLMVFAVLWELKAHKGHQKHVHPSIGTGQRK